MNEVRIGANKKRLVSYIVILLATAAFGYYSSFYGIFNIALFLASTLLLIAAIVGLIMLSYYVSFEGDKITIKQLSLKKFAASDIEMIDLKWFNERKGSCFINTISGDCITMPKHLYCKNLEKAIKDFATQNSIKLKED